MKKELSSQRRVIRRLVIGLGISLLLISVVAPPYGLYRERDTYQCSTCLSKRDVFQWRIGDWSSHSIPLSNHREQIADSLTLKRFTPLPHVHDWRFAQGSPYYWFGTQWGGCAIGPGRHRNDLAELMERPSRGFDDYVYRKLTTGGVTTNQLYEALISLRLWSENTNAPNRAQARAQQLVDEFVRQP